MKKKTVMFGILGSQLDQGSRGKRWDKWRPTVSLAMQDDLLIDRFELIFQNAHESLGKTVAADIAKVSPQTQVIMNEINFKDPWDIEEVYGQLYEFARAYKFNAQKEEYLTHITTGTHVQQICLFLLAEARYLPGRLIQTSPKGTTRREPKGSTFVIDLDLSKYDKLQSRFEKETLEGQSFLKSGIQTANKAFNRMIELIEKVAIKSDNPMLLTGPTGAGKSQLASRIYELRRQRALVSGEFVEVNCATLKGDNAMASLFGHTKGAFTGAIQKREGLLKKAEGGVLFLDEIGELGLDEQAMLLTALETGSFRPVGADSLEYSSFQLIAGTNRSLNTQIEKGLFREDLLSRINLWSFRLPGLVERREDIEPNLNFEIEAYSRKDKINLSMNREAKQVFLEFAKSKAAVWRGNFRDLNASITRMGTLCEGGRITRVQVKEEIERLKEQWQGQAGPVCEGESLITRTRVNPNRIDPFDRVQLEAVLSECISSDSLSEAGRRLFSESRKKRRSTNDSDRLKKYLAKFGLSWDDVILIKDRTWH